MTLDAVWCGVCLRGENQWLSLSFAIAKIGQPSGRSHAVGTDHTEGVRDGAGWWRREPSGHETVPGEGGAYWSLQYVFLCMGRWLVQGCLRNHRLWGHPDPQNIEGRQAILPDLPLYGF